MADAGISTDWLYFIAKLRKFDWEMLEIYEFQVSSIFFVDGCALVEM